MKPLIFIATLLLTSAAFAGTECKLQNLVRTITVVYEDEGSVPCHVEYDKPTEGMTQIPWNAQNEEGYCEARAEELKEKLVGWGWVCTESSDSSASMGGSSMGSSTSNMGSSTSKMGESSSEMGSSTSQEMGSSSSEMEAPTTGGSSSKMDDM